MSPISEVTLTSSARRFLEDAHDQYAHHSDGDALTTLVSLCSCDTQCLDARQIHRDTLEVGANHLARDAQNVHVNQLLDDIQF